MRLGRQLQFFSRRSPLFSMAAAISGTEVNISTILIVETCSPLAELSYISLASNRSFNCRRARDKHIYSTTKQIPGETRFEAEVEEYESKVSKSGFGC
jgi:hypothetical protein